MIFKILYYSRGFRFDCTTRIHREFFLAWPVFDKCFQSPVISGTSRKLSALGYGCYEHIRSTEWDSPQAFWTLKPAVGLGTTWWLGVELFCLIVVIGITLFVKLTFFTVLFFVDNVLLLSSSKHTCDKIVNEQWLTKNIHWFAIWQNLPMNFPLFSFRSLSQ